MKFYLLLVAIVIIGSSASIDRFPDGTSYAEIQELGANCGRPDSCKFPREQDELDIYNCNCGAFCAQLDTCCIDSPFRFKHNQTTQVSQDGALLQKEVARPAIDRLANDNPDTSRSKCTRVYGDSNSEVYLVDSCHSNWNGTPSVAEFCIADGEARSDLFLLVPVTSTRTGTTYRNYYCFVCNEDHDMHMATFWKIQIHGFFKALESSIPKLEYSKEWNSWLMEDPESGLSLPTSIQMEIPGSIKSQVRSCRLNVISNCSPLWADEAVRKKCTSYMGIVRFRQSDKIIQYRNAHCAICNFENVKNVWCDLDIFQERTMSFTRLIDFNVLKRNEVGTENKCGPNSIYDPIAEKCRLVGCVFEDYFYVNGKCVLQKMRK